MIPLSEPLLGDKELEYVTDCIKTNWVSSVGKYVDLFEQRFAEYCGRKYAVATSSGTTALHLALVVEGIGSGDEVIVPTLTFIASANAVAYTGAKPVFVDSTREDWTIDPGLIESAITTKTKAIMPVHLYGHPADMDRIDEIAERHSLTVIADATEGLGSLYKDRVIGSLGDLACFSFNGNKLITTGGGGMIVTDDEAKAKEAKFLSCQARSEGIGYYHPEVGYNYRLSNIHAAIGVAQLEKIDDYLDVKRRNAAHYAKLLNGIKGIETHPEREWAENAFWLYSILVDEDVCELSRDGLVDRLRKKDIDCRPFFYPMHAQPPYRQAATGEGKSGFPVADELYKKGINLPSSVSLKLAEVEYIASVIKETI